MSETDRVRLRRMVNAGRDILTIAKDRRREALDEDIVLRHALVRLLEVMALAAGAVSERCRQAHSDIPWRQLDGVRERLADPDLDVDPDILWRTVQEDVPELVRRLEEIVK